MKPPNASLEATTALWRTYKYRLYPTRAQVAALEEQLVFCCDLYNAALEQRIDAWRLRRKRLSYIDQCRELTEIRAAALAPDGMSVVCQRAPLKRLDLAFGAFFRRLKARQKPGYPRFRSRRRYDSLTWGDSGGWGLRDGRLRLLGIGAVKVKWHRPLPDGANPRTATVRRSCGKWYICLSLTMPCSPPPSHEGPDAGLDLGVACFARLSTGEALASPRAGRSARRKVRRLQRKVARCKRRSNRRRKAVAVLARAREHEANVRRDHRHKLAYDLTRRFSVIYVEDLQIGNMTRSAKGTIEEPGRNVRQKAGLNREILDQAWGEFLVILESEAEEAGSRMVKVPARYTSQTCARCGVIDARSRRSQAEFVCAACGHAEHADTNASQVIRGAGRALQALTVEGARAVA